MSRSRVLLAYLDPALRPVGSAGGVGSGGGGETAVFGRGKHVRADGIGEGKDGGFVDVAGVGRFSFDHLITLAIKGELATGRKVTAAPGISISIADLERIGAAADRVEAKGGKRAVVFSRGNGFVLDVMKRQITEGVGNWDEAEQTSKGARIVSGIDTAVILDGGYGGGDEGGDKEGDAKMEMNPARILAGLGGMRPESNG